MYVFHSSLLGNAKGQSCVRQADKLEQAVMSWLQSMNSCEDNHLPQFVRE